MTCRSPLRHHYALFLIKKSLMGSVKSGRVAWDVAIGAAAPLADVRCAGVDPRLVQVAVPAPVNKKPIRSQ